MASKMQPFMLPRGGGAMKATIGMVPPKPDYYPTANLGIDRTAFAKVGGFRAMRGGGDLYLLANPGADGRHDRHRYAGADGVGAPSLDA